MSKDIILYKSLSPVQLAAVIESGWRCFIPETPVQKFFYPKINQSYAEQIARQWDATHFSAGYVVAFKLPVEFMAIYDIQSIAYEEHREYKIPICDLEQLNRHISGKITIVSAFVLAKDKIWQNTEFRDCVGYH